MSLDTRETNRCFRCEREVTVEEIQSGRAIIRDGYMICPECLEEIKRTAARHGELDTVKDQLATMTAELRNISDHLHHQDFSWLYVIGAVLQVIVLIVLYVAYTAASPEPPLVLAAVVQLMTITAFVVGKLK